MLSNFGKRRLQSRLFLARQQKTICFRINITNLCENQSNDRRLRTEKAFYIVEWREGKMAVASQTWWITTNKNVEQNYKRRKKSIWNSDSDSNLCSLCFNQFFSSSADFLCISNYHFDINKKWNLTKWDFYDPPSKFKSIWNRKTLRQEIHSQSLNS